MLDLPSTNPEQLSAYSNEKCLTTTSIKWDTPPACWSLRCVERRTLAAPCIRRIGEGGEEIAAPRRTVRREHLDPYSQ